MRLAIVPIALGLVAPVSGALSDHVGTHRLTLLGMLFCGLGLVLFYFDGLGSTASMSAVTIALALFGAGQGLFASPNNNSIMAAAPAHLTGEAGSLVNVVRSVGMSLGIATASALLSWRRRKARQYHQRGADGAFCCGPQRRENSAFSTRRPFCRQVPWNRRRVARLTWLRTPVARRFELSPVYEAIAAPSSCQ